MLFDRGHFAGGSPVDRGGLGDQLALALLVLLAFFELLGILLEDLGELAQAEHAEVLLLREVGRGVDAEARRVLGTLGLFII